MRTRQYIQFNRLIVIIPVAAPIPTPTTPCESTRIKLVMMANTQPTIALFMNTSWRPAIISSMSVEPVNTLIIWAPQRIMSTGAPLA